MRFSVALAIAMLGLPLSAAPALAALTPVLGPDGKPLEVRASLPHPGTWGLSLLVPGGAQLALGDPLRGGLYLGATAALATGAYFAQRNLFYSSDAVVLPESSWAMVAQGLVVSWLAVGIVSAVDAASVVGSRWPAWSSSVEGGQRP